MGLFDQATGLFAQFGVAGYITLLAFVMIFVIGAGALTFWFISKKIYYKKLVIFEKIGGIIQVSKKDVARDIRLGDAGDTILYTRKYKKFLPPAQIQTGNNIFWYYIREDGEWINIGIADIDLAMKKVNAHFLDKEMRFARTGMQKNLRDRLQKVSFWDKYGAMIIWTIYIALVGIMTWLLFDKWIELGSQVASMVETSERVMELAREILSNIDNIQSGGSGIATTT